MQCKQAGLYRTGYRGLSPKWFDMYCPRTPHFAAAAVAAAAATFAATTAYTADAAIACIQGMSPALPTLA